MNFIAKFQASLILAALGRRKRLDRVGALLQQKSATAEHEAFAVVQLAEMEAHRIGQRVERERADLSRLQAEIEAGWARLEARDANNLALLKSAKCTLEERSSRFEHEKVRLAEMAREAEVRETTLKSASEKLWRTQQLAFASAAEEVAWLEYHLEAARMKAAIGNNQLGRTKAS